MDKEIRLMSAVLEAYLNKSNLPIEVKRLVLVELLQKVSALADAKVNSQLEEGSVSNEQGIQQN